VTRDRLGTLAAENIRSTFGGAKGMVPPLLLQGENPADYNDLAARVLAAAQPRDFIEELLTRDVVDLTWEILRLRRLKAGVLRKATSEGVKNVLLLLENGNPMERQRFSLNWRRGHADVSKLFAKVLAEAALTMDDVIAQGLPASINSFERLDHMLASAEARRNNALREIDRHRETLGRAVRDAVQDVQDAEFRDLETGEAGRRGDVVTSDRRRRANRANAQASTGPISAAGKRRVAKNALRHGLNVSIYDDAAIVP
jgi:hypothetical protein